MGEHLTSMVMDTRLEVVIALVVPEHRPRFMVIGEAGPTQPSFFRQKKHPKFLRSVQHKLFCCLHRDHFYVGSCPRCDTRKWFNYWFSSNDPEAFTPISYGYEYRVPCGLTTSIWLTFYDFSISITCYHRKKQMQLRLAVMS